MAVFVDRCQRGKCNIPREVHGNNYLKGHPQELRQAHGPRRIVVDDQSWRMLHHARSFRLRKICSSQADRRVQDTDTGSISIGDQVVTDVAAGRELPPNDRGLGVVFQEYAVWPHMTVFDNIGYPLKLQKLPANEITDRVMEAVAQVNLTGMERRLPSQLSGGQQQRVALARALHRPPAFDAAR